MGARGFIDRDHVTDLESVTLDGTIGVVGLLDDGDAPRILIDIQRLRRLLIAYEEEVDGGRYAQLAIHRDGDDGGGVLTLRDNTVELPGDGVALAGRIRDSQRTNQESSHSGDGVGTVDGGP